MALDSDLVDECDLNEVGHQVVSRVGSAEPDVVGEVGGFCDADCYFSLGRGSSIVDTKVLVEVVTDGDLIVVRDAEHGPDNPHRKIGAQVAYEVEPTASDEGVEYGAAILAHACLEPGDSAWGEHPSQQPTVQIVNRRVFEDEHPLGDLHPGSK